MDILIKNATVVDGSGAPAFQADVGITGDTICAVGKISQSCAQVIDAAGRIVMPGIIDPHSHADVGIFHPGWSHQRITQGITTEITGHCGPSPAPNCPEQLELLRRIYFELTGTGQEFDWPFRDFKGWLETVEKEVLSANYGFLVGHGTLRGYVMGGKQDKASPAELKQMQDLLDEALSQGAMGLGLGLSMFPGTFADTEELIALARVVKKHDAIIVAHRRNEGETAYESVAEMLEVARATGVRMNIAHVKVTGSTNWGKGRAILDLIQRGMDEGLDLSLDAYPYTAGYTQLFQIFPISVWGEGPAAMAKQFSDPVRRQEIVEKMLDGTYGGLQAANNGAQGIQIIQCPDPAYDMKTLAQISEMMHVSAPECAIRMIERFGAGTMMFYYLQNQDELSEIILFPHTIIMSDGAPSDGHCHPRYMGAFSQVLQQYVKDSHQLTLEQAVHKMTGMPAKRYRLNDRGIVAPGKKADLIVLDWDHFSCNCTYENPLGPSNGIDYVLLNGEIASVGGTYTGKGHGVVLRG